MYTQKKLEKLTIYKWRCAPRAVFTRIYNNTGTRTSYIGLRKQTKTRKNSYATDSGAIRLQSLAWGMPRRRLSLPAYVNKRFRSNRPCACFTRFGMVLLVALQVKHRGEELGGCRQCDGIIPQAVIARRYSEISLFCVPPSLIHFNDVCDEKHLVYQYVRMITSKKSATITPIL